MFLRKRGESCVLLKHFQHTFLDLFEISLVALSREKDQIEIKPNVNDFSLARCETVSFVTEFFLISPQDMTY
jgi:hypothetical protein